MDKKKEWTHSCHNCRKELGNDWVEVQTPICPVRVHKLCETEYLYRMNMILNGMFGRKLK